jgi:hypothetical protein
MDIPQYLVQTIGKLTPYMVKFQYNKKGTQTDNVVQFMAALDYFTHEALRSAQVACLFQSSKKSNIWEIELCMKSHPAL